jgi:uncharacterized membrane protein YhaH (DUF805 family)
MSLTQLLFSFQGRVNRAKYWLITILSGLVMVALGTMAFISAFSGAEGTTIVLVVLLVALFIPMIWIGLAVAVKRLHDCNRSGWWVVFFYIVPGILQSIGDQLEGVAAYVFYLPALAIWIWSLVQLGFLRGTDGPNQYGPDPLQPAANAQPA